MDINVIINGKQLYELSYEVLGDTITEYCTDKKQFIADAIDLFEDSDCLQNTIYVSFAVYDTESGYLKGGEVVFSPWLEAEKKYGKNWFGDHDESEIAEELYDKYLREPSECEGYLVSEPWDV